MAAWSAADHPRAMGGSDPTARQAVRDVSEEAQRRGRRRTWSSTTRTVGGRSRRRPTTWTSTTRATRAARSRARATSCCRAVRSSSETASSPAGRPRPVHQALDRRISSASHDPRHAPVVAHPGRAWPRGRRARAVRESAGARRAGAVPDDLVQAVDEATTNVILHGYRGGPGWVEVANERVGDRIVVTVTDEARPRSTDPGSRTGPVGPAGTPPAGRDGHPPHSRGDRSPRARATAAAIS